MHDLIRFAALKTANLSEACSDVNGETMRLIIVICALLTAAGIAVYMLCSKRRHRTHE